MKKILTVFMLMATCTSLMAQKIERVEPLSWWVGMNTPLQLLIYGEDIEGSKVEVNSEDIDITKVISVESPNYLFVDVNIAEDTKPGEYKFTLTKNGKSVSFDYELAARRENPAAVNPITQADVVYLLMPDRFAKGKLPKGLEKIDGNKFERGEPFGRHGGNLQGIIDNLDYIADLGVTAIWSTPMLEDREFDSYHGYAISDLYRLDPRHGTNELYKEYVEKAHGKDLKVIMDMVPNHIGISHWWMKDLPMTDWINNGGKYIPTSYNKTAQLDPHASQADYVDNRDHWFSTQMPDVNLRNDMVLKYQIQNAIWWVEYANLDAIRVDTYPHNDKYKVAEWTKAIKDEYPGITLMGEVWENEPALIAYWEGGRVNKDGYDSELPMVMDFALQQRMVGAAALERPAGWNEGAMAIYFIVAHDFLYDNPEKLLIFTTNHDQDRLAWTLKGNVEKQMLLYSLVGTMRGVPQLYYGDEQMFVGDPSSGHGSFRVDFPGGWDGDKRDLFAGKGRTEAEAKMLAHTQKIFNWRKGSKAVTEGEMIHFFPDSNENQYVYARMTDDELAFVVLNFNEKEGKINWDRYAELFEGRPMKGVDIITGKEFAVGDDVTLEPYGSFILELK